VQNSKFVNNSKYLIRNSVYDISQSRKTFCIFYQRIIYVTNAIDTTRKRYSNKWLAQSSQLTDKWIDHCHVLPQCCNCTLSIRHKSILQDRVRTRLVLDCPPVHLVLSWKQTIGFKPAIGKRAPKANATFTLCWRERLRSVLTLTLTTIFFDSTPSAMCASRTICDNIWTATCVIYCSHWVTRFFLLYFANAQSNVISLFKYLWIIYMITIFNSYL